MVTIPDVKIEPPSDIMDGCEKLHLYGSDDTRDVLKVTIQNHNLYAKCASKLKSAISFIEAVQ